MKDEVCNDANHGDEEEVGKEARVVLANILQSNENLIYDKNIEFSAHIFNVPVFLY